MGCLILNKVIVDKLYKRESILPNQIKWLAIGDSHIVNSINPENYSWLDNRAHSGERLLYNFEKIKFYIENNPQIELIILGYWHQTMLYNMDWVHHGKDVKYRYESYLPLMLFNNTVVDYLNVAENKNLFLENYWGYKVGYPSSSVKLMVKNYFSFNENLEMKGGFLKAKRKYIPNKIPKKSDSTKLVIDKLALDNFKEIVSYLKIKKVKLVLYNSPLRKEFIESFNNQNIKLIDKIALSQTDSLNVWYINHSKYDIPDEYFNDLDHLNINGANYITPILIDSIINLTGFEASEVNRYHTR